MIPPPGIRRPVTITAWVILSAVVLAASPLLLVIGALVAALTGDRRLALMTRVFLAYFARELATLAACGGLWLLAGAGWAIRRPAIKTLHWRLLRWFVAGIASSVRATLEIRVVEDSGSEAADAALHGSRPLLVLSRHAGPADTILLIDRLLTHYAREPSVVFKETIVLDPSIDLLAHRLPHAVLDVENSEQCASAIADTAAQLGPRGVLLMFPEGGNFSPERRRRALRSLRRHGQTVAARAAERLHHVLPPRPSGTVAALAANPAADVVFAAHTGLGLAAYPIAIWRQLPVGQTLTTRLWLVPRADIPTGEDEIAAWLNDWWARIDAWVDGQAQE